MLDSTYNQLATVYYHIYYLAFGIPMNFLMLYMIFKRTTKVFESMKYFLIPASTCTLTLSSLAFFVQVRTISNIRSMAVMGQGFCKTFGAETCFHSYIIVLTFLSIIGVLNVHTILYRMLSIKYDQRKSIHRYLYMYCISYTIPLSLLILSYISPLDMEAVYNETITQHSDYTFEPFGKFGGFANSRSIYQTMANVVLIVSNVYTSFLGYYCRWSTLKVLEANEKSLSKKNVIHFKSFILGLTLQITLPLICYIPNSAFFYYNKHYEQEQLIISQYLLGILLTLPAIIDPMLNIYFIVPYRTALRKMIFQKLVVEPEPKDMFTNAPP